MRLAVSNFAWDKEENKSTFKTLKEIGINQIEGVLTKIEDWDNLTEDKVIEYKLMLNDMKIQVKSLQSIFFNVNCDSMVTDSEKFIKHFETLIKFSKILDVEVLVFGSPGLRKTNGQRYSNLHETFKQIDNMLEGSGIILCIEPNAKTYGGEFFYTIEEIVGFLKEFKFKNIFTMCDTHNSILEGKDPIEEIETFFSYIKHVHVSEPKLVPLYDFELHKRMSDKLKELNYTGTKTYELVKCENLTDTLKEFYSIYK